MKPESSGNNLSKSKNRARIIRFYALDSDWVGSLTVFTGWWNHFFLMIGGVFFSLFMNVKAICWALFCGSVLKRGNNSVVLWSGNAKNVQNTLLLIGGI